MMKIFRSACLCAILGVQVVLPLRAAERPTNALPPFEEVYSLVRSNLSGTSDAELNRAAVLGLLSQLQSRLTLLTNAGVSADANEVPLLSKSTVLEGAYAFLRIGRVGSGLAGSVKQAYDQLAATNVLKGLIVDLRFAFGQDYGAAAETADLFYKSEQPLLQWGEVTTRSTAKASAIDLPLVILINRDTSAAAEAFAAALRQSEGAILIGSPSAGRAYQFTDLPLSSGGALRVASGYVAAGNGERLSETGLVPDIGIAVKLEDEKAYFEDPYKVLAKPFAQSAKPATNEISSTQNTNRPRRRLNEAELVRMQREGLDFESEALPSSSPQAAGPVVSDPAVSRALDLLKGLALASKRR